MFYARQPTAVVRDFLQFDFSTLTTTKTSFKISPQINVDHPLEDGSGNNPRNAVFLYIVFAVAQ